MHQVVAPKNAEERDRQQVRQAFRKVFPQSAFCFLVWFHDWIYFLYLFLERAEEGVSERLDMKQTFLVSTCDHRCWHSFSVPPCLCYQPRCLWTLLEPSLASLLLPWWWGQWQGFPKNWKDPCFLSFIKTASGCSPMWLALCSHSASSLLLSFAHWPSAISTFFWFPKVVHCLLPGSFQTLGFNMVGTTFSGYPANYNVLAQIPLCQQIFLRTYNLSHAIWGVWGYIIEQNRKKPCFCGPTCYLFLKKFSLPPIPQASLLIYDRCYLCTIY